MSEPSQRAPTLLGRVNASLLDALDGPMHRIYGHRKEHLLAGHPDTVVEIGAGSGANMRYLRPGTRLIAIEPNTGSHAMLQRKAAQFGLVLETRGIFAEKLDLPDHCTDLVLGTLVLCTVRDPGLVLAEVLRILRPGGRYVFVEHVKAPDHSALLAIQRLVKRPWKVLFDGCHTDRDTAATLRNAGFASLAVDAFQVYSPVLPIIPQICGVAQKAAD
jgi:ubiquinone/menaquinone biosynthesis C-methylase UbiE